LPSTNWRPYGAAFFVAAPVAPAFAKKPSPITALDTDNDSTVDANEVEKSAEGLFDKLDTDKDGSLEPEELHGRLSEKEFKAADPDNDGTLDEKIFASKEGKSLLRVAR